MKFTIFAFWGSRGGPGGARKGPPFGPPPGSWILRKSKKPWPPARNTAGISYVYIIKGGPGGAPAGPPFSAKSRFPIFVIFTFSLNFMKLYEIS